MDDEQRRTDEDHVRALPALPAPGGPQAPPTEDERTRARLMKIAYLSDAGRARWHADARRWYEEQLRLVLRLGKELRRAERELQEIRLEMEASRPPEEKRQLAERRRRRGLLRSAARDDEIRNGY
ncbi:hypothetical protein GF356_09305 [candidate division GN15 bacterium]|nr:hypothetical protein [candidate division GN15 bacterium]